MEKKIILFDSNALVHRSYYALPRLEKDGILVNAVYGFLKTYFQLIGLNQIKYAICIFDAKKKTFRNDLYKEYKAKRIKAPDDLYAQIPILKSVLEKLNIPIFVKDGYEADDIIATFSKNLKDKDFQVVITTGDKDLYQLIDENKVVVCDLKNKFNNYYNQENFVSEYGFQPKNLVDYKALAGDASDNIPGVKGIGKITAKKLICQYQTLENIYKNIDQVGKENHKVYQKLIDNKEMAILSKKLVKLRNNLKFSLDLDKARIDRFDKNIALAKLKEMGFVSLVKFLPKSSVKVLSKQSLF
ncbi:MAG: polymerase protein [Berkelbacteria bacterium GW2011_GWA2_35_9]|uniref:Polymerase protein n=1 Tax=Berkelbacteria bacterium GW2011_GWA2_35_9 TaxID=1618333 RepID=A0A0G0D5H6_9BACT|nr:MAG: polymerase protein [Berkelbacteria bacterium GW2011_GWA2_35_9]